MSTLNMDTDETVQVKLGLLRLTNFFSAEMAEVVYGKGTSAELQNWLEMTRGLFPIEMLVGLALARSKATIDLLDVTLKFQPLTKWPLCDVQKSCEIIGTQGEVHHVELLLARLEDHLKDVPLTNCWYSLAKSAAGAGNVRNLRLLKGKLTPAGMVEIYTEALKAKAITTSNVLAEWMQDRDICSDTGQFEVAYTSDHPPTLQMWLETWGIDFPIETLDSSARSFDRQGSYPRSEQVLKEYLALRVTVMNNNMVDEPA